jgi:hypothetical protein
VQHPTSLELHTRATIQRFHQEAAHDRLSRLLTPAPQPAGVRPTLAAALYALALRLDPRVAEPRPRDTRATTSFAL